MKRFLYTLGVVNVTWVLVGLTGVVLDAARLEFWTWNLMAALLGTVVLAPLLVFMRSSSESPSAAPLPPTASPSPPDSSRPPLPASASSPTRERPAPGLSIARDVMYTGSGLLILWLFVSLFGLFLNPSNLGFWTQSVMWTLVASVVWAPVLVFVVNPFASDAPPPSISTAHSTVEARLPPEAPPKPFVSPTAHPDVETGNSASILEMDSSEHFSPRDAEQDTGFEANSSPSEDHDFRVPSLSDRAAKDPDPDWDPWPVDDDR